MEIILAVFLVILLIAVVVEAYYYSKYVSDAKTLKNLSEAYILSMSEVVSSHERLVKTIKDHESRITNLTKTNMIHQAYIEILLANSMLKTDISKLGDIEEEVIGK